MSIIYFLQKEAFSGTPQAGFNVAEDNVYHCHPHATDLLAAMATLNGSNLSQAITENIKMLEYCSRRLASDSAICKCNQNFENANIAKKEAKDDCDLRMVLLQKLANITINEK